MLFNHLFSNEIGCQKILYQIKILTTRIYQSWELSEILNIIVSEMRATLKSDRVVIYRFIPQGDAVVAEESVSPLWTPIQGQLIDDPCFQAKWVEQYQAGRVGVIEDINTQTLDPCYKELLTKLDVQANLVAPILVNTPDMDGINSFPPHLWGLLIVHQCSSPRWWSALEIEFTQLVALELGTALQQTQENPHWHQKRSPQLYQYFHKFSSRHQQKFKLIKKTLQNDHQHTKANPHQISAADLVAFDRLQMPIWIYDIQNLQMWWVNKASLHLWNAKSREELLNYNFSNITECTKIRLQSYIHQFEQGQTIAENWTFYPESQPVSVHCLCSGVQIADGRMAMLVEGTTEVIEQIDQEILRAIEGLRHTTLIISLYTMDGVALMQNPAALRCYGDTLYPSIAGKNAFLRHFVDPGVGHKAMNAISFDESYIVEAQVFTTEGIRWHEIDIRCTLDPITGNSMILVNEKDITQQQMALELRQRAEEQLRWQEALLRSMTDTSLLAFFVVDNRTDEILYFNHRFCEIWGIEHLEERMRLGVWKNNDIIPECLCLIADVPAFAETCQPLQSEDNRCIVEDEILFLDGRTIRRFSSQIRGSQDQYFGRLYVFEDITSRKQSELALQQQMEQERMIYTIAQYIHHSLDIEEILNTTVTEVRNFLQTDRVVIYRFNSDWGGVVVTESVVEPWQAILNMQITDDYFVETQGHLYQQGKIRIIPDIYTAGFSDCHLELLETLQVRAKLVVPIVHSDRLWGLLIVHHCRGTRVWQPNESELLQQLATQVAIAIQQSELYQQLQLANQHLQNLAMVDQLTQIANRRFFDINLNHAWHELLESKYCVSLLLCDIDYFKQYNDTYGHAVGDDCLRLVAQAVKNTVKRAQDLVARYGGEEFGIILPNTDSNGAVQVAKEIHQAIHHLNIPHSASAVQSFVTLSIGIATAMPLTNMLPIDFIEAADQALYQAKAQGRNRSVVSQISSKELPTK